MMDNTKYKKLLEPGYIGSVKTRNRIIKSGAGMFMWHETDVHMREEVKAYYESMARGGVGLIMVEAPGVDYPWGTRRRARYRIDDDKYIDGLKELTDVIHKHDCPTFMQMNHDGPWQAHLPSEPNPFYDGPPVAASAVSLKNANDFHNEVPKALTIPEIEGIVEKFAAAAVRAKKAGFEGVDINAASSHLFHNFFSPFWNRRDDIYGGSQENRARILVQLIQEIKRRTGKDFAVSCIINGLEVGQVVGIDNSKCLTPEESRGIAVLLEKAGADMIQVRSHWIGRHLGAFLPDALFYPEAPVDPLPEGYDGSRKGAAANILLAAGIKKRLSIPVAVVGRLDADLGEKFLREGLVDFIVMTRRLMAEPDYVNKIAAGRLDDIAPCTACINCLRSARCRVNALLGTPYNTIEKTGQKKKVLVIGGGPGGMEAARVSALRGHEVTLYERAHKLGGLLPLAAMIKGPHPEDLPLLIDYLEGQIRKLGVRIELGKEADLSVVERLKPDVVFVAAGGLPTTPEIPGIDRSNVISGGELHRRLKVFSRFFGPYTLRWLSKFYMPIGKRVVVIGGALQGCELGEFLTKRGRKVTIVEKADQLGDGMAAVFREHLMVWFEKKGVTMLSGVREYVEITDKGLTIVDKEGKKQTIEADTIVPALPLTPNMALFEALQKKVPEVYAIGDC
ncbi:MAG: FAD-dependent oxidoreductase, partial [Deltaproteobacteria bacterium]|nr:FAD-dependent oxidoreductase [Deltaproteobacteria bacterium]